MFKMGRGKLIVIEGTDGSGKQTQSEKLVNRLKFHEIKSEMMSFPTYGTAAGDIVGDCYLGKGNRIDGGSWFDDPTSLDPKVASLYYAADRKQSSSEMIEKLSQGINIICDRYVESNMGHQCGKLEDRGERDELRDWIYKLEYGLLELPKPDSVVFLYMPFKVSQKLKKGTGDKLDAHEANEEHLRNAERAYLELSEHYGWYRIDCSDDGENPRDIGNIHTEVSNYVFGLL